MYTGELTDRLDFHRDKQKLINWSLDAVSRDP